MVLPRGSYYQGFILSGVHVIAERRVWGRMGVGRMAANHQLQKFPPLGLACILCGCYILWTLRRERTVAAPMLLGLFLFFGGHLPQTFRFHLAKQLCVANFLLT